MIEFVLSHMNLQEFSEGPARRAAEALLVRYEAGDVDPRALLESADDPELRAFLAGVMTDRETPSENWARKLNISVPRLNERERVAAAGAMTQLKLYRVQQEIASIRDALQSAREEGADVTELARRSEALHDLRKQIERQEFIQWPEAVARRTEG
jgi:DNA primase